MNLVGFIQEHGIKCEGGVDFSAGPAFEKMKTFERTSYTIRGIPCLLPETYELSPFDLRLRGRIQEKWDKREKKTKQQFFVDRFFDYPGMDDGLGPIEDSVPAGKTIDEAVECLGSEIERFLFFRRYDLIDTGRYWLNRQLKWCVVDDGRMVVLD